MLINCYNLKATVDDVEYTWNGGFGSIITSHESGLKKGEIRMIGNHMFRVSFIYRKSPLQRLMCYITNKDATDSIHWAFCEDSSDVDKIRAFKMDLFSV